MPNFDTKRFINETTSILHTSWEMQMPSVYLAFNTIHAMHPCRWNPPFHASNFIISIDRSSLYSVVPSLLDCKDPDDELVSCDVQLQTRPFNFADLEPPVPAGAWFAQNFFSRYRFPRYTDQTKEYQFLLHCHIILSVTPSQKDSTFHSLPLQQS